MEDFFKNRANRLFVILGGFFITNAIVAEFIGIKIFSLEKSFGFQPFSWNLFGIEDLGFNLTAGAVLWPVVFIMTDIINEYFGKKGVRFLSWMAVGLIVYAFVMVYFAIRLSPNEWWDTISGTLSDDPSTHISGMDQAFGKIFGQGLWIIAGSVIAFLVGQLVDVLIFQRIKKMTGEKFLWLRATGSTLISQFIDSFVVLFIAFYWGADWNLERVLAIGIMNYIYKFGMAFILTPVIYLVHWLIDLYLGKTLSEKMRKEALEI